MHFMDMKRYTLICFFIFMLVGKEKEQGSYKMEVVIRQKNEAIKLGNEVVVFGIVFEIVWGVLCDKFQKNTSYSKKNVTRITNYSCD